MISPKLLNFIIGDSVGKMTEDDAKLKQGLREKALKDLEAWKDQRLSDIEKLKAKNRLAETSEIEGRNGSSVESSKYVLTSA